MNKRLGLTAAVVGAVVVLCVASYFGARAYFANQTEDTQNSGGDEVVTLDPALFSGEVRKAYEVARQNPTLLVQLHCYCGCDRVEGHKNLLDCFRDRHGGHCEICVGEVLQANRMFNEGAPVDQIRDALRARYARFGS